MHLGALALFLALFAPPLAEAQQAAKVYRIGVLVLAPLSARPQQWGSRPVKAPVDWSAMCCEDAVGRLVGSAGRR